MEDPQQSAVDALLSGNLRLLTDILTEETICLDIDKQYPEHGNKTLLHLAVEAGHTQAVRTLLGAGAKIGHFNTVLKMTAIHVVATKGDHDLMAIFLKHGGKLTSHVVNIKDKAGRTPLHLAASKGHAQCAKQLIEAGAGVNMEDNKGGQTPLTLAAVSGHLDTVQLLLRHGADLRSDAENVIKSKFSPKQVDMLDLESIKARGTETGDIAEKLFKLVDIAELDGADDIKFRSVTARATIEHLNTDNGKMTLVQMCAARGLSSYVSILLSCGADPNMTTLHNPTPALLLAAAGGQAEVMEVMLDHNIINNNTNNVMVDLTLMDHHFQQTVLHQILRKPRYNLELSKSKLGSCNYEKCLELIMNTSQMKLSTIINCQDLTGNTALHYATQHWGGETVTQLLLLGANIGLRNNLGETPISNILPSTMENYLNNHCIKSEGNPTNEDFKISLHYDFLAPPRDETVKDDIERDSGKKPTQPETDVLWYMARSKDHRHLLKHPVITSFLALKWSRISVHYNTNLIFSAVLVSLLTLYIFTNYAGETIY